MTHGAFSKEILADLMSEADRIAAGEAPYATMEEGFGELD